MFHVCIAHCMPAKIHKMSKCKNSCLFVWSTVHISSYMCIWYTCDYTCMDHVGFDLVHCAVYTCILYVTTCVGVFQTMESLVK